MQRLCDQLKTGGRLASAQGTVWHCIGTLHAKYGEQCRQWLVESQDQMYSALKVELESDEPRQKVVVGILHGLRSSLEDGCTLEPDEVQGLFIRLKTGMTQIPDVRRKGVQKASMQLFGAHLRTFKQCVPTHVESMLRLTLELCIDGDMNLRDDAHEMLGQLMLLVDECLLPEDAMIDEDMI
jgi:hypothetical protein